MFRKVILSTISIFSLFSASVFAVGLGEIKQSSGLNQPLNAEIPLLSAGDLADYEVLASLASNSEFEKVGVEKVFFLNSIKFETARNSNDQIIIKLSTRKAVKEPFLNFVVELNWPNGRILREYTLLLDPPIFEEITASTIEKTKSERPKQSQASQQNKQPAESRAPRSNYDPRENVSSEFSGSTYGPVKSTDTLWSIATRARPDSSVTIHQTLVAIYRANPDAFADGNINNLLRGKVLNLPDASTIRDVPQRAALQDVVMQNRQWRSGGARKIVDRTGAGDSTGESDSGGSRLSLAAGEDDGDAQGYGSDAAALNEARNDLVRSQEETATLQAENDALRSRLAEILKKAEDSQGDSAVDIDDAELAALGQVSQEEEATQSDDEQVKDELGQDEAVSEESITQNETENGDKDDSEITNQQDEDALADSNEQKEASSEEQKQSTPPAIFKSEQKEKGFVEQLLDGGALMWGSIAGIVVVILLIVFWRMKKRMEDDEFQDDLVASAGAGSMDTTETFELPDVGDDMLVELDMDDDEDVSDNSDESFDPLGEAGIYIAYGKHEQAENILLEAIEDNPVRADLKVKLMECYAESDSQDKFEALALEVSEAVDSDEWAVQINGMRAQAWGTEQVETEEDDDDFDLPSTEDIFGEQDDDDELDVDFASDDSTAEDNDFAVLDENDSDLDELGDFAELDSTDEIDDIDGLDELNEIEDLDGIEDLDAVDDLDSIEDLDDLDSLDTDDALQEDNFSLDIDEDMSLDADELTDSDEISLDMDDDFAFDEDDDGMDFDENLGDDGDEIATKLDLARAYVDMGDSDGAKEILKEVIAEGSEEQKNEAQELIDKAD